MSKDVHPIADVITVPRSFVERVMYSGAFEIADLQQLRADAEAILERTDWGGSPHEQRGH